MGAYHYPKGVKGRLASVENKYSSGSVKVEDGDLVIDIGANIGEFSLSVAERAGRVFSIDPDPNVWNALSLNLETMTNVTPHQYALSDRDTEMQFYVSTKDADSSAIQPKSFSKVVTVSAVRLDTFIAEQAIEKVDFLKLEAEGWEPEILAGATHTLMVTKKVAVDAGPERHGESTVVAVTKVLEAAGFSVSQRGEMVFAMRGEDRV